MYVCCLGGGGECVCVYFIIRYTGINRLASGRSSRRILTVSRDFYATIFLSDCSRTDHLLAADPQTFFLARLSRNRVCLRAGALHLPKFETTFSRMTAGTTVVATKDFVSRKGTVTFYFNRLTKIRDRSIEDHFPWIEDMNSTIAI